MRRLLLLSLALGLTVTGLLSNPALATAGLPDDDRLGGAEVQGATYRAVIHPTGGQLMELRAGATNALEAVRDDARGAVLRDRGLPLTLPTSYQGDRSLTVSGPIASITYTFGSRSVRIVILNAVDRPLTYTVRLADRWRLDGRQALAPWGRSVRLETQAPVDRDGQTWRVTCRPLARTQVILAVPPPQPEGDGRPWHEMVWAEPRTLTPSRFVLPFEPPFVDTDGANMSLPLLIANDRPQAMEATVTVQVLDAAEAVLAGYEETLTLPARDVHWLDARCATLAPGVYRLRVIVAAEGQQAVSILTLDFAPERRPAADPAPTAVDSVAAAVNRCHLAHRQRAG